MNWSIELIREGKHVAVCALIRGTRSDAKEFLDACEKEGGVAYRSLFARITTLANEGIRNNTSQYKEVRKNLYELKGVGVRLFGFFDETNRRFFLLTHGWKKGPPKEQTQQIERAEKLRNEYLATRK
jgi:hypothetical protein